MTRAIYRNTYAKIELNAIKHNLNVIQTNLGKEHNIIDVLNADAYAHGSVEVARFLESERYDLFAVALVQEATEPREAGIQATILILRCVAPKYAHLAAHHNFIL